MKKKVIFVTIIFFTVSFWGCEDEEQHPPVIKSLTANPEIIQAGEYSVIICDANDTDGDELTYSWESSSGAIEGSGNHIIWTSPESVGSSTVSCTVEDGNGGTDEAVVSVIVEPAHDRVYGTVHGLVTDYNNSERIENVTVTWGYDGSILSTITDQTGYYILSDLHPGDYEISFNKGNYAIGRINITIPTIDEIGPDWEAEMDIGDGYYISKTFDIRLYSLNASVSGIIYKEIDDENIQIAENVNIVMEFVEDISPNQYVTTTNSQGQYSLINIPATPTAMVKTLPFNDGTYDFGVMVTDVELFANQNIMIDNIILSIATDEPFIVQNNFENDDFGLNENIIITFSKAMKTTTFEAVLSSSIGNVESELSWNDDITLILNPYVPLIVNQTYNLSLTGESQDNNSFSGNYVFETIEGIEIVWTNLERVDGIFDDFQIASNIEVTYSMEIDLDNPDGYVNLYDENSLLVSIGKYLSPDSKTLIINPSYYLEDGQNYLLELKVYSTIEGEYDYNSRNIDFTTSSDVTIPSYVVGFSTNMGTEWSADWNTTSISFKWNKLWSAEGYRIYARDNHNNSDLVSVGNFISAADYVTEETGTIYLNSFPEFDYFMDDNIQTPFTNDTEITFKISAYNDAGEGNFLDSLVIKDLTTPSINISQSGSADNTTGENAEFVINLNQIEYCSASNNPTFSFVENGGDPGYVLSSSAIVWEWDSDLRSGQATVTVPDGKNGAEDMLIATVFDNSGNISDPDTLYLTPIIDFVSPTAGTTWEAPTAFIDWSINNTGAGPGIYEVDVYLSIDGGITWIDTLTEGTYSTYYDWDISDTLMSDGNAIIGITNTNGGYIWKSDSFTINGIKINTPVPGENEQDKEVIEIAWDHVGIDYVLIEYFSDGFSWTEINSVPIYNTGNHDWEPDLGLEDTTQYKVRVSDYYLDNRPSDESEWFTVLPEPSINIIDPNGGEIWLVDNSYTITWASINISSNAVSIGLYFDGTLESTISPDFENTGSYDFLVPSDITLSDNYSIRISDSSNPEIYDESDSYFTISAPSITVLAPNGGEEWETGATETIIWGSEHISGNTISIELYMNGVIESTISSQEVNTGSYLWLIPNNILESGNYVVHINDSSNPEIFDESDSPFSISEPPPIRISSPNGSEEWVLGTTQSITWTSDSQLISYVSIELYENDAFVIMISDDESNDGTYEWSIPDSLVESENYKIRIVDVLDDFVYDESDSPFALVSPPFLTVISPNGAEEWVLETTQSITWTIDGSSSISHVHIDLYKNDIYDVPIVGATDNLGSYSWSLLTSYDESDYYKIRITDSADPDVYDESDNYFSLIALSCNYDSTSTQYWYSDGASTTHYFYSDASTNCTGTLIVTVNGDYDQSSEDANVYIEGNYIGQLGEECDYDNTVTYNISSQDLSSYLTDSVISIQIINSSGVNTGICGYDYHRVQLIIQP